MPTHRRLTSYFVINPGFAINRLGLSSRLGKLTYELMTRFKPDQERVAKKLWNSVKRRPSRNPLALFHFWHLINMGVIDFNRVEDLDAFCTLLNTYPAFRQIFVNLSLSDDEHVADVVKFEAAVKLPIHIRKGLDLLAISTQKKELEVRAVQHIKDWLNDPVVMTRFVDRCAPWLVHLDVNTLQSLLEKNHAAVRFLNPDSFGIPYAHSARVLQKRFESKEQVIELLTRDVTDVPEHLAVRTEQYYFATAVKFAFEYQRPLIKNILRQMVVDYPQELPEHLQIIYHRLFGDEPNLYLADFISGRAKTAEEESHHHDHGHNHDHHHHDHEHHHSYSNSEEFELFEILCGEKYNKHIAGQKFTERLTQVLNIRGNPLAFVIELINLDSPYKNVLNFVFKNITTLLPIVANSLDSNGVIALNDLLTRKFRYQGEEITMVDAYNEKFQALLSQLSPEKELSLRERADVFAEIRANLENDNICPHLIIDTKDVELLVNDPVYGKSFAPIIIKNISHMEVSANIEIEEDSEYFDAEARVARCNSLHDYVDSLEEDDLADAYLLASTYWDKISPRNRTTINKFFNWLNKVFKGGFERRFAREEQRLAETHSMFEVRLAYEKEGATVPFDNFLVDYATAHWVEDLKQNDALAQLIASFLDGKQIVELMNLTESHDPDEDNSFKRAVMASPYLKARLLDYCAIENPENALNIIFLLMEDKPLIAEYFNDAEFRALVAKILQQVDVFSFRFMVEIADIDMRLFVEMLDHRFDDFISWFFGHYHRDFLNLLLQAGHNNFCARVLRELNEIDSGVIRELVQGKSEEFIRACTEQPGLVRFILEQPSDLREIFYEDTFYLVAAMYARGDGKVGFDLDEEITDEISDIIFDKAIRLAELDETDLDNSEIPILRNLLSSLFEHAPKIFFRDLQETELFALYKHLKRPSALFKPEFVASHKEGMVQMFCEHILEIDIDYWPVVFNNQQDLERVFVYLNKHERKDVVDRLRELPDKTMYKQLAALDSPAMHKFLQRHEDEKAYALLRKNHAKLMRGESSEVEETEKELISTSFSG